MKKVQSRLKDDEYVRQNPRRQNPQNHYLIKLQGHREDHDHRHHEDHSHDHYLDPGLGPGPGPR